MPTPRLQDSITQFLIDRKAQIHSLSEDQAIPTKTFSFTKPHRCAHCQKVVLDGLSYSSGIRVFRLDCSVAEAVTALIAGCKFYERLIDFCSDDYSNFSNFPYPDAQLVLEFPSHKRSPETPWFTSLILSHSSQSVYIGQSPRVGKIFFCTQDGNPAASIFPTRPHEPSFESQKAIQFARDCLYQCKAKHDACRVGSTRDGSDSEVLDIAGLPTRLLEVSGEKASRVRLVEVTKLGGKGQRIIATEGFVALSYCWGRDQPLKLTTDTAEDLRKGFATNLLPNTLQDAVKYTSILGMRYLWIDALCISQDDDYEKGVEISRMPSYYHQNTITLCAASSDACDSGFLGTKKEPQFTAGPFEISMKTASGMGSVFMYDTLDVTEATTLRAWTLQESLLSRRNLVFGTDRLIWCCLEANAGCGGPYATLSHRLMDIPASLASNIYPMSVLGNLPSSRQWEKIILNYTRRQLTNPSDKLLAIAAAASTIHGTALEREKRKSVYLAGLLVDVDNKVNMSEALGWLTAHPTACRIQKYSAPSWSWACIDGEIDAWSMRLQHVRINKRNGKEREHRFRVLDYGIDLKIPKAPYGAVTGGYLKMTGFVWSLNDMRGVPVVIQELPTSALDMPLPQEGHRIILYPDTKDDRGLIETTGDRATEVFLFELNFHEEAVLSSGLMLIREGGGVQTFRRVGAFRYDAEETTEDLLTKGLLFPTASSQDVTLV